tara:strand:- start:237 stop:785 length:549 start_codon:yes stop_codon:yes gene_type:complete
MIDSLKDIKDDVKRNQQAKVLINIMGNLNTHLRDVEEYKYKLWDHLFIMCNNELKIDSPYPKPNLAKVELKERIDNTQGTVKNKHYGKLIVLLIKEAVKIKDDKVRSYAIDRIAQQMKRSYLNWNQTNVQDPKIWADLEAFSEKKLNLDTSKIIPVYQQQPQNYNRKKTFYKKSNRKNYQKK